MIVNDSVINHIKTIEDKSINLIFGDPPYNLGSTVYVGEDGKMKLSKTTDFMGKWKFDHEEWETFFEESFRILKHGGFCVLFAMDRQTALVKYYAIKAGLEEMQSLYWYQIQGFPKSLDISKGLDKKPNWNSKTHVDFKKWLKCNIDKNDKSIKLLIQECGFDFTHYYRLDIKDQDTIPTMDKYVILKEKIGLSDEYDWFIEDNLERRGRKEKTYRPNTSQSILKITGQSLSDSSISDLAQKYDGYKGSIAPMKPCMETILVFRKPLKSGRFVDDILEYENGDSEVSPSILNIDGSRVGVTQEERDIIKGSTHGYDQQETYMGGWRERKDGDKNQSIEYHEQGRYPAQMYVNPEAAEAIDKQSGISKGHVGGNGHWGMSDKKGWNKNSIPYHSKEHDNYRETDSGGASRILHVCDFEPDELVFYSPKVSSKERNAGLPEGEKSNHPTVKPIQLIKKLATLFKLPDDNQKVYIPFSGSGSEIIGFLLADYKKSQILACELSNEYIEIAKARIEHWRPKVHKLW